MHNSDKTVAGEYPTSYCLNQPESYGIVRKTNTDQLRRGVLVKTEVKTMIFKYILKCITNNCKLPQNLNFRKTELSLFLLDGRMEPIACLLFYLVVQMEVLTWPTAVKTLKKHQNTPTRTLKKNKMLLYNFLDEYT